MAVYFDHRLDTDRSGINIDTQWYDGSPILAVNTYSDDTGGSVNLFLDEVFISELFCLFSTCTAIDLYYHARNN